MQITFIDTRESWSRMLPLTYTRPVADMRVGILKIYEKWSRLLNVKDIKFRTEDYLSRRFKAPSSKSLTIKGGYLPSLHLAKAISLLSENQALVCGNSLTAGFFDPDEHFEVERREVIQFEEIHAIEYPWDIFRLNGQEIKNDYELITSGRRSIPISDEYTKTYDTDIFVEEGAIIKSAILNAKNGPIYIGKNTEVQEGSLIRGPFALCDNSVVTMGAKIKGDSTIGPYSKVGGEISNAVIHGYSNKAHDGFLGNSAIGEWCNLGAGTNNSNLKNNYANVKMWDFDSGRFKDTDLQFCGLVMGDHSKCGINTMFNTGTTVGISANIFGGGFPRNFIPSFAWGGASGFSTYQTRKVFETEELVMARKNKKLKEEDRFILNHVFDATENFRVWDKK